jgi:hypothetical protein
VCANRDELEVGIENPGIETFGATKRKFPPKQNATHKAHKAHSGPGRQSTTTEEYCKNPMQLFFLNEKWS